MIDPNLPLIDLHRHLDGNVRLETILDLARQHHLELPAWDVESLRPYIQITETQSGVMAFIEKFHWMIAALADYEACRRVAYENVEDARNEGLDYIELRFSPWFMAQAHDLDPAGIVEAVCDGIEAGRRDFGMSVNLIGILSRTYGVETCWKELAALLSQASRIVALDLAGDEAGFPAQDFVGHFQRAHDAGWQVTVHAGESDSAQSIWVALKELGAQRIGHAVTAVGDAALMDYMAQHEIGVECNLTSNVQTSTVADYASHPLLNFLEHGVLATINTDDPAISGIDLRYEYQVAAPAAGLDRQQIQKAQWNALQVAFLSTEEKKRLLEQSQNKPKV